MPNADYKNKDSRVSEWPCDKTGVCNFATRVSSLNGHNKRGYNVSDWVGITFARYSSHWDIEIFLLYNIL